MKKLRRWLLLKVTGSHLKRRARAIRRTTNEEGKHYGEIQHDLVPSELYLTLNVTGPGGLCHAMFGLRCDTEVGCTHLAFSGGRKLVEKCYCLPGV